MSNATKHYVNEMDSSQVQKCIICGETIADYRNVSSSDGKPIKGFPPGEIYVSSGNPTNTSAIPPRNITINKCS